MEFLRAKKIALMFSVWMAFPFFAFSFICPERPQRPPYNIITGNIVKVDEPERTFPVPLNSIRITLEGTNYFGFPDSDGAFYFGDIQMNTIRLRFEYSGSQAYLDLGEVGFNNQIVLNDLVIARGMVNVGKKDIKPFQTMDITGTKS